MILERPAAKAEAEKSGNVKIHTLREVLRVKGDKIMKFNYLGTRAHHLPALKQQVWRCSVLSHVHGRSHETGLTRATAAPKFFHFVSCIRSRGGSVFFSPAIPLYLHIYIPTCQTVVLLGILHSDQQVSSDHIYTCLWILLTCGSAVFLLQMQTHLSPFVLRWLCTSSCRIVSHSCYWNAVTFDDRGIRRYPTFSARFLHASPSVVDRSCMPSHSLGK